MDKQTGEAVLRYPLMLPTYRKTGDWIRPNISD